MNAVLQAGNRTIAAEEIIPLLTKYQMLPQLMRESIIDQAIASIKCTPEETAGACQHFYQQNQLTSEAEQQAWLERHSMTLEDLEDLPALPQTQAENLLQRLANPSIVIPRLAIPFEQWGALLGAWRLEAASV